MALAESGVFYDPYAGAPKKALKSRGGVVARLLVAEPELSPAARLVELDAEGLGRERAPRGPVLGRQEETLVERELLAHLQPRTRPWSPEGHVMTSAIRGLYRGKAGG